MKRILSAAAVVISILLLFACASGAAEQKEEYPGLIKHNGKPLFMSGMNLAWINFGQDLTKFDEVKFNQALEDIAFAGGNTIRWWIHVNGSQTPLWKGDRVTGMPEGSIDVLEHALDLAADKNIGLILCLWSFDMLQNQTGVDRARNKRFLEDPALIKTYVDNALTPMVKQVKGHPALIAWEVCNEPDGMMTGGGWAASKVDLNYIQALTNLVAGGIHRVDPFAKVTIGIAHASLNAEVDGFVNYFSDERLIEAGGDKRGTLDFYQVHYYPNNSDTRTSPFHNPASHWNLDKPVLIGEFPAKGIMPIGKGFMPQPELTIEECYRYAMENGYAGALSWTWTAHDGFGSVYDASAGMAPLRRDYPELTRMTQPSRDKMPSVARLGVDVILSAGESTKEFDLTGIFVDAEDGESVTLSILEQTNSELFSAQINGMTLSVALTDEINAVSQLTVQAEDSAGNKAKTFIHVYALERNRGNALLLKPAKSLSDEDTEKGPLFTVDGKETTRWSSSYANDQWLMIDLQGVFELTSARLLWEVAYGREYIIQVSMDGETWTDVYTETESDGKEDILEFDPVQAAYFRMYGVQRGTEWGFSLWEISAEGIKAD